MSKSDGGRSGGRLHKVLLNWLVAYPLITLLLAGAEPLLQGWPLPLRTLLITAVMTPLLVLWLMPLAAACWLRYGAVDARQADATDDLPPGGI